MISQKNILRQSALLSRVLIFMTILCLLLSRNVFAADEKKKDDPHAANSVSAPPPPVYIPPLPRHVEFPTVTYGKEQSVEGEMELNLATKNFWYVVVISSWNPKSKEITSILNHNYKVFESRKIGVIGLFSTDTVTSVSDWRTQNKPLFETGFASRNFLDALKNPKIPSVWVLGRRGEILQRLEIPSKEDMQKSVQRVMIMTGF
ncbi:hypothetical protein [Silvanigrella aquatica]|uniref:Alkyl hydroperoxide reductase subunit C/ Thiol specific antioxidant domain-containing protein n=1 Tax=Silvanigrella aquatica TaxID=1915309 RepID=A0A1L4D2M7_9BACT|nr:hypothetical protein [Silvanigrella aquatica]APJ04441.1 hypothetical protein AXG55_11190 [Silvanigrella aquatica]